MKMRLSHCTRGQKRSGHSSPAAFCQSRAAMQHGGRTEPKPKGVWWAHRERFVLSAILVVPCRP